MRAWLEPVSGPGELATGRLLVILQPVETALPPSHQLGVKHGYLPSADLAVTVVSGAVQVEPVNLLR